MLPLSFSRSPVSYAFSLVTATYNEFIISYPRLQRRLQSPCPSSAPVVVQCLLSTYFPHRQCTTSCNTSCTEASQSSRRFYNHRRRFVPCLLYCTAYI